MKTDKTEASSPRRRRRSLSAVISSALVIAVHLLSSSACSDQHGGPFFDELDDWTRVGPELQAELSPVFEGGLHAAITRPIGVGNLEFDRVGMMFDAKRTPKVEVRVSMNGGLSFTEWLEAPVYWNEGKSHNAHVDVPKGGSHVQIRFSGIDPEELSYLFVDAFEFEPDPIFDDVVEDDLETLHQALAANAGVDVTRAQWGARATRCTVTHSPYRMAIHHTVTPNNDSNMPARMRGMQNYHMDTRGYCDLGYHFCVGQDGKVYQGRPEGLRGAHVGGANTGNTGISFIGTYSTVVPSSSMMNAGAKIIRAVADYYRIAINRDRIKGHREYGSTECPGNALYPKMDELVALAQAYGGGGTTPTKGVLRGAIYHGDDLQNLSNRISGATVALNTGPSTTTDGEGWYRFDLDPGTYTVTATATGYSTETSSRDVTSGATTWGSIRLYPEAATENGTVRGVVFWVDDPSEFSQYVGDASRRIAGATVTFTPGGHTATTGGDGYYQLEIPAGTYSVSASAAGYDDGSRPDDVVVTAGQINWGSTHVIRPGEDPVVPAPVVAITDPPNQTVVSLGNIEIVGTVTHSADLGSFTVRGQSVTVSGGAFRTVVQLEVGENEIEAVAVDDLGQTGQDSITVVFDAPQGGIDGHIYDVSEGDEARIAGARVLLPEVDVETVTDATGSFSLDLDGGTYAIRISSDGFVTHRGAISVVPGHRLNLRIGLEPGSDISEQLVEISFPIDGEILSSPDVLVMAAAAVPDLARATINGVDAALGSDGAFSAAIRLEPGENTIEAIAYRASDEEVGRATVTVTHTGGGCGCTSSSAGGFGLGFFVVFALSILIAIRPRR